MPDRIFLCCFLEHASCIVHHIHEDNACVVQTGGCFTGARVFGVMKGAADGGLDIPHRY